MVDRVRVLLVDDNPDDRALTLRALREEFGRVEATEVADAADFERALEAGAFDLVITDYRLRWSNGLEVLRAVKEHWPDRPVVMFTATGTEEIAVEAMKAGLDDYVLKSPKHFARLPAVVRLVLTRAEQSRRLRETEVRYRQLFERVPVGLYRTSTDDTLLEANPALAHMLGYPDREMILGMRIEEFYLNPEDRHRERALLEKAGSIRGFEMRLRRRDGQVIWVRDTARAVRDDDGRVRYYEGSLEDITEQKRSREALERRAAQLALLAQIGREITGTLDLQTLLEQTASLVHESFGYPHVALFLVDRERDEAVMRARAGEYADRFPPDHRVPLGQGLVGWVAQHGEPVVANDVEAEPRYVNFYRDLIPTRSELCYPLRVEGQVEGVLDVQSSERDAFDKGDVAVMEALAAQIGVALRNAQLFEEAQRRALEQETLREATLALSTVRDPDEAVERILAELERVVPYDSASVQWLDGDLLRIVGGRGFPNLEELLGITFDVTRDDNPNHLVMARRSPVIEKDVSSKYAVFRREPHAQAGIRSWLGVPMMVGDRLVGMIALDKREPDFYTQEHARLAEAFATQAAVALENARLYEAEHRQREFAEALAEAAAVASSTLDLEQVLDHILEQVQRVVAGDAFNIALIEDDHTRIARTRGYERLGVAEKVAWSLKPLGSYPTLGEMIQTGGPVIVEDTTTDPRWVPAEGLEWLRSYVAAPIRVKGMTVGFLNVDGTRPGQFTPDDGRRLLVFADHVGTAIENARLYQQLRGYTEDLEALVKERTAELSAQYARLEAILNSIVEGIVVTDSEGRILQTNPVVHTLLERRLPPSDAERLRRAIRQVALRAGEQPETALELSGMDLELMAAPIRGEKGGGGVVVAVHDVTHLRALDRMKTRFISNISHELRTPIATVKLYAELIRRQPTRWAEHLSALDAEVDRLITLIEDILEISRIDAGRIDLSLKVVALDDLVAQALAGHEVLAAEKGIALEYHPADPGPVVEADPDRLRQVVDNLLSNAVRYTPAGGRVVVSTGRADAEGRTWATLTVADTGIGIPEDELPHIFERFFRGETPRRMQVSGTGLGLSIAKEIVEMHGGFITVESEVGKGSTFTVWMPPME